MSRRLPLLDEKRDEKWAEGLPTIEHSTRRPTPGWVVAVLGGDARLTKQFIAGFARGALAAGATLVAGSFAVDGPADLGTAAPPIADPATIGLVTDPRVVLNWVPTLTVLFDEASGPRERLELRKIRPLADLILRGHRPGLAELLGERLTKAKVGPHAATETT